MLFGIAIIFCSLFYSIMVSIVYFKKSKINNTENKIYSFLMKINVIGLLLELACCYLVINRDVSSLFSLVNVIVNKLFIIYLLTWEVTFTSYIFFISFKSRESFKEKIEKEKKKILLFILVFYLIMLIIVSKLPLYYFSDATYVYSYGPATNLLVVMGALFIGFDIFCLFKNLNNIKNKKYYPLFILVILMIGVVILRNINPGIIIINSVFAFVTVLMYFTIENPDLQMVDELLKNREIVEKSLEDRSATLLTLTQEVKKPLRDLKDTLVACKDDCDNENHVVFDIIKKVDDLNFIVNNVLNITSMDVSRIKLVEHSYNTYNFFYDISKKTRQALVDKDIELNFEIKKSLPNELYGDSIKIKQILMAVIYNAIKHTKSGFIDVSVDSFTRYDVCRLIINISDSGCGMTLDTINELLKYDQELEESEFKKLEKLDVDLSLAIKIIRILGGNINIKSEINKGSSFNIVIDQKVSLNKDDKLLEDVKRYNTEVFKSKRILVVNDNVKELKKIDYLFNKYNIKVTTSLTGRECVQRIKNGEKYNLILLDDEMKPANALTILKELKNIPKFKMPVLVMLNKEREIILKHYLEDGFDDVFKKQSIEIEVERIFNKYL